MLRMMSGSLTLEVGGWGEALAMPRRSIPVVPALVAGRGPVHQSPPASASCGA